MTSDRQVMKSLRPADFMNTRVKTRIVPESRTARLPRAMPEIATPRLSATARLTLSRPAIPRTTATRPPNKPPNTVQDNSTETMPITSALRPRPFFGAGGGAGMPGAPYGYG
ncbi:Uncharacterised protein [Mycobacteroides abscessus subsp. abscessus]|nr:Uncharacterised protein [Mycobacteroides abscessus subsp. abscessus]